MSNLLSVDTTHADREVTLVMPFDVEMFKHNTPLEAQLRMDAIQSLEPQKSINIGGVIEACVNLWPWLGHGDDTTAYDILQEAVLNHYGGGEENFTKIVDDCFLTARYVANQLNRHLGAGMVEKGPVVPTTDAPEVYVCVGGEVKSVHEDYVVIKLHYMSH